MAITNTELFGAGGFSGSGSTTTITPPAAVATAGPLAIVGWMLDRVIQAQINDTTNTSVVATRQTSEQGGIIKQTYTITLNAPAATIASAFAAAITDPWAS